MQYENAPLYELIEASDEYIQDVLKWRNTPKVRDTMIQRDEILWEDHLAWWRSLKSDKTKKLLLLKRETDVVAVVTFYKINAKGEGWWGFYLTDAEINNRLSLEIWMTVEGIAIRYAFDVLCLSSLYCETRKSNEPVLAIHDRHGFETLASSEFPNAVKHDLIVKHLKKKYYERDVTNMLSRGVKVAKLPGKKSHFLKLAFVGSANWDEIASGFPACLFEYAQLDIEIVLQPFGQARMNLFDKESELSKSALDYLVFCERMEDFISPFSVPSDRDISVIKQRSIDYIREIKELRQIHGGHFFIHEFNFVRPRLLSLDAKASFGDKLEELIKLLNKKLKEVCDQLYDCTLLPVTHLVAEIGENLVDPEKYWFLGRFPYGPKFTTPYQKLLSGAIMALHGLTARAIVLDLDNTCWGGVIGDDGPQDIKLGSDYPGNQFVAFQMFIKSLSDNGIPITLCSKNDEKIALRAFRENSNMILTEDDIIAHRINWDSKSQNIRELALELDLGLRNLLFIDDNPMERLEVRENLSDVCTPELPADVAAWPRYLAQHPALCALTLTSDDKSKLKKYKIRREIKSVERTSTDKTSFLSKLEMKIEIVEFNSENRSRAIQLLSKTNQFNTTGKRYSEQELKKIQSDNGDVLTVRIKDKFGSDEIIAVVIIKYFSRIAYIDNYVMSCRVMGRGVETAVLADICNRAIMKKCKEIRGEIIELERNTPCREVYSENGFIESEKNIYARSTGDPVKFPKWFNY